MMTSRTSSTTNTNEPHHQHLRSLWRAIGITAATLILTSTGLALPRAAAEPTSFQTPFPVGLDECSHISTNNLVYCGQPDSPEIASFDVQTGAIAHVYPVPLPQARVTLLGSHHNADIISAEREEGERSFALLAAVHDGEIQWQHEIPLRIHCGLIASDNEIICTELVDAALDTDKPIPARMTTYDADTGDIKETKEVTYAPEPAEEIN